MSKGGFKYYTFSFTGDGRTAGTEVDSSGLGDAETLCLKIITNAASCLMDAGWQAVDTCFYDYSNNTATADKKVPLQYTVKSTISEELHSLYLYKDTTGYIMEVPLTYTRNSKVTRIWLLYYWQVNTSRRLVQYLNDDKIYSWKVASTGSPANATNCGFSILYLPPDCTNIAQQCFKLACIQGYSTSNLSASYGRSLAYANTKNSIYTYGFICKNDFIAMTLRSSGWANNTSNMLILGELLDTLLDPLDMDTQENTFYSRKYAALTSGNISSTHEDSISSMTCVSSTYQYPNNTMASTNINIPWMQWYNTLGEIQMPCSETWNAGLLSYSQDALRSLNYALADKLYYSKIIIGNTPMTNLSVTSKVSAANFIKGSINPEVLIAVWNSYINSDSFSAKLTLGQTLDNGNYTYIGGGLCLGWDSSNIVAISGNSPNAMATPTDITPSTP